MILYATLFEDGRVDCISDNPDLFIGSIPVEWNGTEEDFKKYYGCLKVIDNEVVIDYERYEEMQEEANQKSTLELMIEALDKSKPSIKKKGYHLELAHSDGTFVWEFVKNEVEDENDGTDYLKPITYTQGMSVVEGKWYILEGNTNECIKTGDNSEWSSEWFDLVEI